MLITEAIGLRIRPRTDCGWALTPRVQTRFTGVLQPLLRKTILPTSSSTRGGKSGKAFCLINQY